MMLAKTRMILCLVLVAVTTAPAMAQDDDNNRRERRQFDIKAFVNKIDQNQNGILEPGEMSDRTKRFINSLGFNAEQPVKVELIIKKVNRATAEAKEAQRRKLLEANRKVPGFGVVSESESSGVPGFGTATSEEDAPRKVPDFSGASGNKSFDQLTLEYGGEAVRQVRDTLRRYDLNRSGVLEADEIQRAKWGRPDPAESDINHDGKLTREELAARYAGRLKSSNRRDDSSRNDAGSGRSRRSDGASSSSSRSGGNDLKSRMERYRERVRAEAEGRQPESSRSKDEDRRESSRSSAQPYNAGTERYARYADALIRQYDKDKDGKLNKEEVGAMRRPPSGADADGDGVITRAELIDSISGATKQQGSSSETGSSSSNSQSRSERRSSSSSRSNSRSVSFSENDTNGDGQLQMHEFAREWNDEVLREFKAKDKNGDGVITRDEWNGR